LCLLPLGYTAAMRLLTNQELFGTTQLVPLGLLISNYMFFVVTSTGLCFLTSFGHVFGIHRYEIIAKRGVFLAIVTLVCGFISIGMEVEHPFRLMVYMAVTPNFTAPIFWMGLFYTLYLVLLIIELVLLFKGSIKYAFYVGLLSFVCDMAANSCLGYVLGSLSARPFWYGPYLPIIFIVSAFASGAAFLLFATYVAFYAKKEPLPEKLASLTGEIGRLLVMFLGVMAFFILWKVISSLYGSPPNRYEAIMAMLTGPLGVRFWFFEVLLGLAIPMGLLIYKRNLFTVLIASVCSLVGLFIWRLDVVYSGQMIESYSRSLAQYSPSAYEWFVVLGCVALCALLTTLGEKFLPLNSPIESCEDKG